MAQYDMDFNCNLRYVKIDYLVMHVPADTEPPLTT
jgi:hypothetical protein